VQYKYYWDILGKEKIIRIMAVFRARAHGWQIRNEVRPIFVWDEICTANQIL
jgi:hypothetical protein